MSHTPALLLALCLGVLLTGCADKRPAPIEDRSRPGSLRADERYTVLPGDTLFSIAFRYGLDFRRLAAANSVSSPFTIYPGQTLRLAEASPRPQASTTRRSASPAPPAQKKSATTAKPTPRASTSTRPDTGASGSTGKAAQQAATPRAATSRGASAPVDERVSAWRWPASGPVTRRFETSLHKGIDIGGSRGDAVLATAGGRVVYAGSGIAGYGLMLIIRHNDEYLSAYGHNDSLLVDEGDAVRAGEKIAERGSSGTDSLKLHFEIRRRGRPVDPLGLLPRR